MMVEVLPCGGRANWNFVSAELVDCSANGVGLIVEERFAPGEHFILKLKLASWMMLLYKVRYCEPIPSAHQRGQRHRVGAELLGHADVTNPDDPHAAMMALAKAHLRDKSHKG